MIITITGKPCSGKGTVGKLFAKKYNFEFKSAGDMMRSLAEEHGYSTILEFQTQYPEMEKIDNLVDNKTKIYGEQNLQNNVVFDGRLAWFFIPKSFKVFIDVDWSVAGNRLINANREHEKAETQNEAIEILKTRWQAENERYQTTYNTDNLNLKNYNLVINSSNKTPEEIVEEIYESYLNFLKNN